MSGARRALPVLGPDRLDRLRRVLDDVRVSCDSETRRRLDPVSFVHAFPRSEDREIAGLVASACAFGNVAAVRGKLNDFRDRVGHDLARAGDDRPRLTAALAGFRHRLYTGDDLAALVHGARIVQRAHGSLGAAFASCLESGDLATAIGAFGASIREAAGLTSHGARRGPAHLLPDPRGGSAAKRLLLYLRWMVRDADGVDLGLWREVSPAVLLVPVDVHVHKLAWNLGLTTAPSPSWRAAEEITSVFRMFDPWDPVKYDFALCHLGMASGCASRFVSEVCGPCAIREECRHGAVRRRQRSTERAVRAKVPPRP
jgi:uncharacterized protein (TIGR02757 family)